MRMRMNMMMMNMMMMLKQVDKNFRIKVYVHTSGFNRAGKTAFTCFPLVEAELFTRSGFTRARFSTALHERSTGGWEAVFSLPLGPAFPWTSMRCSHERFLPLAILALDRHTVLIQNKYKLKISFKMSKFIVIIKMGWILIN